MYKKRFQLDLMGEKASVKVPNGKLVKVEAEFDDVFQSVSLTGDFFIEPPDALEKLNAALEGLPVDAGEEEIARRIEKVGADLIGFSPEHIAEALVKVTEDA